jgi:hypothetical protein
LIDFHAAVEDKQGHWRLGNALGNVRVWNSSKNRGDGDSAPSIKLKLCPIPQEFELEQPSGIDNDSKEVRLRDSAIAGVALDGLADETQAWIGCDPDNGDPMNWTKERALAFQKAIETRTFNLYQRFYSHLRFNELNIITTEKPHTSTIGKP